jgi:hypothetical protein
VRTLLLLLFAAAAWGDSIEPFGRRWDIQSAADWALENVDGVPTLKLLVPRPSEHPRRPVQYALAETAPLSRPVLELEVKRTGGSLILVYTWRDRDHFNYVHISEDPARKQPVHNGVFHVYGGDRVRISKEDGPPSLPTADWTRVRLAYDETTGRVSVEVNGSRNPSLEAVDLSLGAGRVGIGSFFETGWFRNAKITGE